MAAPSLMLFVSHYNLNDDRNEMIDMGSKRSIMLVFLGAWRRLAHSAIFWPIQSSY